MFRLRRKKGQGAIEYLFMIAAALVIILIAVRYVGQSGQQASEQGNIAQLQAQAELAKSNLVGRNAWDDDYTVDWGDNGNKTIVIKNTSGTPLVNSTATNADKYKDLIGSTPKLKTVYDNCMSGNENYCYILIDLG
ncbi:class III signal peptide-containing protein [Thermococcus aciditolerans]|uniref:Class III signal peptide-containing protein n=1 Tax=Thermococcus aciditolerans TaxID=2598455 RepID=A0A5C0SKN6_9EURY|nr:class III signal peptide-containing protein [Thermococcus aciditolerans]QEK14326.1 class III signal peptide-containing protein [Thermococcus aciditolerans]